MLHDPYSGHDGMMGGMGQQPDRRDLKIGKIWNLLVLIIVAQCVGCLVDLVPNDALVVSSPRGDLAVSRSDP